MKTQHLCEKVNQLWATLYTQKTTFLARLHDKFMDRFVRTEVNKFQSRIHKIIPENSSLSHNSSYLYSKQMICVNSKLQITCIRKNHPQIPLGENPDRNFPNLNTDRTL